MRKRENAQARGTIFNAMTRGGVEKGSAAACK
jgi:hypothetical protein